jgi:PAS domain S-box-containing protein
MYRPTSPHILIIEDNPGDFFLIKEYLEEHFTEPKIMHAKRFSEAESMLMDEKNAFDVVLLDLTLPDKTGEELINGIVSQCPVTPVIILTGFTDIEFSIRSLTLRVSDYLIKDDITPSSLHKSIIYNIERKKTNLLLEESEKRYSDLFQMSPQPMWIFDLETLDFFQVNDAALKHYGYTENEFLQLNLSNIVVDDFEMDVKIKLANDIANQINVYKGRFKHRKKNGEIIDVDIYGNIIQIKDKSYESAIAIDVTEKIRAEFKITRAIIKTQEDERYEIGTELHDNVCQILASSKLSIEMICDTVPDDQKKWLIKSKDFISLALEEIRNISHRLAPSFFDEKSIIDSFQELLLDSNPEKKWTSHLNIDFDNIKPYLNRDIELAFYRITQEQIRNINKYAFPKNVFVDITTDQSNIKMSIKDDGVGFDVSKIKRGIGLSNIRRRAEVFGGNLDIISSPGNGCTLLILIPFDYIHAT